MLSSNTVVFAADYTLLEPGVFGQEQGFAVNGTGDFTDYANMVFTALLTLAIALAILYIVIGGFTYVTSSIAGEKEAGKNKIKEALKGLLIILLAWLILNTINPDLINWKFKVTPLGQSAPAE